MSLVATATTSSGRSFAFWKAFATDSETVAEISALDLVVDNLEPKGLEHLALDGRRRVAQFLREVRQTIQHIGQFLAVDLGNVGPQFSQLRLGFLSFRAPLATALRERE